MSTRVPDLNTPSPRTQSHADSFVESCWRTLLHGIHSLAFWGAIGLPVPMLAILYGGLPGTQSKLFGFLVVAHVACLVAGHNHSPTHV